MQFIKSLFDKSDFGPYEIQKESHSSQLSDKETVYEIQCKCYYFIPLLILDNFLYNGNHDLNK